jgi:probable HAF family extracellular repeat protein
MEVNMKHIRILACILGLWFISAAWAQQPPGMRHMGRHLPKPSATVSPSITVQADTARTVKFHDLGHYPHGTWAEPWGINKAGVVVGMGDIASGYTRPISVPLFGPHAGKWFDLGTLGGETTATYAMCMAIADTGMIVGHAPITGNEIIHAFAWTPDTRKVDIGTLADIGYTGYEFSIAWGTNRSGTLIVGWSASGMDSNSLFGPTADALPVVWTPNVAWESGQWKLKWQIHKLDTTGFEGFGPWAALFPNDRGQILGIAVGADGTLIGVLWTPTSSGEDWKIKQLPGAPGYNTVYPVDMNNNGEIVGDVLTIDTLTGEWTAEFPAYWKPTDRSGVHFNVTVLPTLGGYLFGAGDGEGINDVGDIVGGSTDADGNYYATAWSTKDPNFAPKLLPSPRRPGSWSWASKVNHYGIVSGSYGNETVPENAAVWTLR